MDETEKLQYAFNELSKIAGDIDKLKQNILNFINKKDADSNSPERNRAINIDVNLNSFILRNGKSIYRVQTFNYKFAIFSPPIIIIPLELYKKYSGELLYFCNKNEPGDILFFRNLINTLLNDAKTESWTSRIEEIFIFQDNQNLFAQIKFSPELFDCIENYMLDLSKTELKWRKINNE